jgi:two-component system cell cycle sensor histidine kinase/response regulator CckA
MSLSFDKIDRRLATSFLGVVVALFAVMFLLASVLYVRGVRAERQRLTTVIGAMLAPSIEGIKDSGEYKLQHTLAALRRESPAVAYVRVVGRDGVVMAADGLDSTTVLAGEAALLEHLLGGAEASALTRELVHEGTPITEVASRLTTGYRGAWTGVLRVGIWGEPAATVLARAGLVVGGVLAVLLALTWPVVLWLGRRLGAPIKVLAQDFEGVMRHAPLHIVIEDGDGVIARSSEAFRADFGLTTDSGVRAADFLPAEVRAADLAQRPEVRMLVRGEPHVFLTSRFPVALGPRGEVMRAGVISTDVTAWRRDRVQRDQMVAAVENTDDQLLIAEPARGVVYSNPAFLRHSGHHANEVFGQRPELVIAGGVEDEAQRRTLRELGAALAAPGTWRRRVTGRKRDGSTYACDLLVSPITDEGGEVQAHVWVARDISRQVQLEAELRQSQKMEAVGRLAGGVAHDFNNLLTVINSAASLLEDELSDPDSRESARMISEAGRRAAQLTRQLLAYSRRQVLELRQLDLNSLVSTTLALLDRVIGKDVTLLFTPGEELWTTRGDPGQIEQVLMNLAINARDAMPAGGVLEVRTENAEIAGLSELDGTQVVPGSYVVLSVRDTGVGMSRDTLEHIFEPFFTTKSVGKGTGLGLATVHGIVRQSGGHIWVDSTVGVGSTFHLAFPRVLATSVGSTLPARASTPAPAPQHEHILVVEDDDNVRSVIQRLLERAGYRVTTAEHGEAALRWLNASPRAPDLILTDLNMPVMGGLDLRARVHARAPEQVVLFMSGYNAEAAGLHGEFDASSLIQKPPVPAQLLEQVRRALDERRREQRSVS